MYILKIKWSLLWSLFILVLCFLPGKSFPSSNWFELFQFDKIVHAFLFMLLYLILVFEQTKIKQKKKSDLVILLIDWNVFFYCLILAVGTELIQHYFLEDRYGDYLDFIANVFGIILAVFFWEIFKTRIFKNKNEGTV
jgi:hypothetical protein